MKMHDAVGAPPALRSVMGTVTELSYMADSHLVLHDGGQRGLIR